MPSSLTIALYFRPLAVAASLFAATCLALPASVVAQEKMACACESGATSDVPSQEPEALQIALDVYAAGGGRSDHLLGAGGALRVGEVFPIMGVSVIPEVGVDVFGFGGDTPANVFGGFAGGRLRFGRGIQPGLFAHLGAAGVRWHEDHAALTADVGVSVDLTFIPNILFGVQGGYKSTIAMGGKAALPMYIGGFTMGMRL